MDCRTPGFPVHHQLPEVAQTHVHRVDDAKPSHPLSSPFSSCPQSFPASVSFPMSQFFPSGGQSIGASASASVLPTNIQDWFPVGLTSLISLQSRQSPHPAPLPHRNSSNSIHSWHSIRSFPKGGKFSCCYSVAQLCPTLCDPMDCSTPGFQVLPCPPKLAQTHVHWISDAIQPSHPRSSPSPPASNPSQHQSLFQWVNSSHEVAKVLELQL